MASSQRGRASSPDRCMPQLSPRRRSPRKSSSPRKVSADTRADTDDEMPQLEMEVDLIDTPRSKRTRKSVERFSISKTDYDIVGKQSLLVKDRFPREKRISEIRAAAQPLYKRKLNDDDIDLSDDDDDRDELYKPDNDHDQDSSSDREMDVDDAIDQGVKRVFKPKKKYKTKPRVYSYKLQRRKKAMQQEWRERERRNENVNKRVVKKRQSIKRDLIGPRNREDLSVKLREKPQIDYSVSRVSELQADIPVPQRSMQFEAGKWRVKDKRTLEVALRSHHPDDIDAICEYLPNKTRTEIENYMTYLKNRTHYPEDKQPVPDFVAPIDKWTSLCDDMARGHDDYADYLSRLMTICGDLVKADSEASSSSQSVGPRKPDYSAIYRYLSDVLDRKKPPELGRYESAVLVDLLQILANTISCADVTSQTAVMSRKYSLLSLAGASEGDRLTSRVDTAREGWSFPPSLEENDPSLLSSTAVDESLWNNHRYSDDSFCWPDSLLPLVRRGKGRLPAQREQILTARLAARENQMQCFTLNPFGVTKSILRLTKALQNSDDTEPTAS